LKILIVEDDVYLSEIYQLKFEKRGHEVRLNRDGRIVKENEEWCDVIVLDILLPHVSGLEIATNTKKPVVLVTQIDSDFIQETYRLNNVIGYLRKADHTPTEIVTYVEEKMAWKS